MFQERTYKKKIAQGGDGGRNIIPFTANNFVNSVLANVIIKIKENYINA